jgi:hypothetical protein
MKSLLLFLLTLVSCLQDEASPEGVLQNFIEARIDHVVTREFVLDKVTGKMKASLENISDDDFSKFADMRGIKKESFKILSKSCQDKICFLTYSVSYKTLNEKDDAVSYSSEVKKIAELVSENGKWLIADVSNIKTYHESIEPINP